MGPSGRTVQYIKATPSKFEPKFTCKLDLKPKNHKFDFGNPNEIKMKSTYQFSPRLWC